MEASSGKAKRPMVIDFLLTLLVTFCIGVVTSLALVGSVILMAGEAHGAAQSGSPAHAQCARSRGSATEAETRAKITELALTHQLVTKYTGLVAIDRTPVWPLDLGIETAARPTRACSRAEARIRIAHRRGSGAQPHAALRKAAGA